MILKSLKYIAFGLACYTAGNYALKIVNSKLNIDIEGFFNP
jgi:hypothetical protein